MKETKGVERTTADAILIKKNKEERQLDLPTYGKVEIVVHENRIKEINILNKERFCQ